MVSDLIVPELAYNITIPITINDDNGDADDLTVYSNVRLVIAQIDYSANVLNKTQADAEVELSATKGILNWKPTSTNKTPAFGKYWLQVFRESASTNRPVKKFTLETTREATKA